MKKIQSLIEKIGLKRYLKSLQFRIFIILCVVGIAPILLMKMSILKNYQDQSLISDAFYTGQKIMLGLKRFAYPNELLIKVFAYHDDIPLYLEEYPEVENHTACSLKTIRIIPQWEIVISGI